MVLATEVSHTPPRSVPPPLVALPCTGCFFFSFWDDRNVHVSAKTYCGKSNIVLRRPFEWPPSLFRPRPQCGTGPVPTAKRVPALALRVRTGYRKTAVRVHPRLPVVLSQTSYAGPRVVWNRLRNNTIKTSIKKNRDRTETPGVRAAGRRDCRWFNDREPFRGYLWTVRCQNSTAGDRGPNARRRCIIVATVIIIIIVIYLGARF